MAKNVILLDSRLFTWGHFSTELGTEFLDILLLQDL